MPSGLQLEGVGDTVGERYQIEALLGRGGMAAVYRARDARTGRIVALKRSYARDPQRARKRQALLEREYHMLAQLAHPRIIEVFDYGVDERGPFYTMELLDGGDLAANLPMPWMAACALLRDVASSLSILHSRGLIHRDVSARNVRSGPNGQVKLIDFGATASMGVAKEIAGTPPFVPPEAMQMQGLDARVDLYALGALGYYLLTGRHAYPARNLNELRDLWRSTPPSPARFLPELPPALNQLILQLLSLDRHARPLTAADVMKRLCAIAGLRDEDDVAISRAYLTAPSLVGREDALLAARKRMLSLVRGDGGCVLVDAVAGAGRSRMLDACVLEAKLMGALVVRADASDGESGDWGVARALGAQLMQLHPQRAQDATRLSRDVLGYVIDGLRDDGGRSMSTSVPEHNLLIRELRDFVLSLARAQRLVVAVDDADRIDAPSLALLAALAHKADRSPVLLVLSVDSEGKREAGSPSLRLLRMISHRIGLDALHAEQTESLMRSVFGDVTNLQLVANRVHALSHGSPRATMELAQHLVNRGLARYDDGSWSLPPRLDERDLPSSLAISLAARLDELSEPARTLAEALCLCDGDGLTLTSYAELLGSSDPAQMFAALDELVAARVVAADGERYRFTQRGFLGVLQQAMHAERSMRVHARIADLLARSGGDLLVRAHHLLHAGREREAIALLSSTDLLSRLPELPLLELAVDRAERLGLPARELYRLRIALLSRASLGLAADSFRRHAPAVLAQLERDSGLACYRELLDVPEQERLTQAFTRTQRRFLELPADERVLSVVDAIRELARLIGTFCSIAPSIFDLELLESLPSLAPLLPLSPALGVVDELLTSAKALISGRGNRAEGYERVLARISEPDRAGLDDVQYARTYLGVTYLLGLLEAAHGSMSAEQRAQVLERDRELRANAFRVRMSMHLAQGNAAEARKCQARGELLQLQEGVSERYLGSGAGFAFRAHSVAEDLAGVQEVLRSLQAISTEHPGWRPVMFCALSRNHQLQRELDAALAAVTTGIAQTSAGRHVYYVALAAQHVSVLTDLGRIDEAVRVGRDYLALCADGLAPDDHGLWISVALALSAARQHDEASAILDRALLAGEQRGRRGMTLGVLHEARARVALAAGNRADFERHAEQCAREYSMAHNPALSLKFAALMAEADRGQLGPLTATAEARELLAVASQTEEAELGTIHSRIAECVDQHDRARCALTILLQSFDSFAGFLYGLNDRRLILLSALPEGELVLGIDAWAQQQLAEELDAAGTTATATVADESSESESLAGRQFIDPEGRRFEPILLVSEQSNPPRAAALLLLQYPAGPRVLRSRGLLVELADLLLENHDVTGCAV